MESFAGVETTNHGKGWGNKLFSTAPEITQVNSLNAFPLEAKLAVIEAMEAMKKI